MWNTIILYIITSIFIIWTTHYIWEYFKQNYTVKKTKDLVEIRAYKYKKMIEDMEHVTASSSSTISPKMVTASPPLADINKGFIPLEEKEWLQKELSEFMDSL